MKYDKAHIDDDGWVASGIDLELRIIFDSPFGFIEKASKVIRHVDRSLVRWEILYKGGELSGQDTKEFLKRTEELEKETRRCVFDLKVMSHTLFVEYLPPIDLTIGCASEEFYFGETDLDLDFASQISKIAESFCDENDKWVFAFAFEHEAERLAEEKAHKSEWTTPNRTELLSLMTRVTTELRLNATL